MLLLELRVVVPATTIVPLSKILPPASTVKFPVTLDWFKTISLLSLMLTLTPFTPISSKVFRALFKVISVTAFTVVVPELASIEPVPLTDVVVAVNAKSPVILLAPVTVIASPVKPILTNNF